MYSYIFQNLLIDLFICIWEFELLLYLGYYSKCCKKHRCTYILLNLCLCILGGKCHEVVFLDESSILIFLEDRQIALETEPGSSPTNSE